MKNKNSDSFEENDDFATESESGDEDWDSYDEEYDEGNEEPADSSTPAKKSNFNNIVMGVAVVVALAVGGFKIFGGAPAPAPSAQPSSLAVNTGLPSETTQPLPDTAILERPASPAESTAPSAEAPAQNQTEQQPLSQEGFPPAPISDQEQEEEPGAPNADRQSTLGESESLPMPAVISQKTEEEPLTPMPDAQPAEIVETATDTLSLSESSLPEDASASPASTEEPALEAAIPTASAQPSEETARQLDSIMKKIDSIESGVNSGLSEISELKASLRDMESRIAAVEKMAATKKESARPSSAPLNPEPSRKPATDSIRSDEMPAPSHRWILKSAQSGQAMVAQKDKGDILSVTVGDRLPGIGKIVSISLENGRWVVKGETGEIVQ